MSSDTNTMHNSDAISSSTSTSDSTPRPAIAVRLPADSMATFINLSFADQMGFVGQHAYKEYKSRGDLRYLETSIKCHRLAMNMTENDSPKKAGTLAELAISLQARYKSIGELRDLEESISLKQLAVALTPDESSGQPGRLMNLAISLKSRYERGEGSDDLEEAIRLETRAIELAPDGHADKPALLNNLGISLKARFQCSDSTDDLDRAISLQTRAVDLTADDNSDKPSRLTNLATSLQRRFERFGDLEDLERAIALHSQSISITPDGQPHKPAYLNNAGNALYIRFGRLGDIEDISRAIEFKVRALALIPDGHPEKNKLLNNLAGSIQARFDKTGDAKDLEQAIVHQTQALELTPDGHPEKLRWLNNLRMQLEMRFEQLGNAEDLDAIYTLVTPHINAVTLTPDGHPDKQRQLHNLSYSLRQRFIRTGNAADLEEAIKFSARSVKLVPQNHSERARNSRSLGSKYLARLCSPYAHADDATHAMDAFLEAMHHPNSPPLERLPASGQYARVLTGFSDSFDTPPRLTALKAWDHALSLVPQCIWLGHNARRRYASKELHIVGAMVSRAAADAIEAGEYRRALEWLEAGRSVVWSQVLQLRTPLDDLQQLHPQLADELQRISQALRQAASSTPPPVSGVESPELSHGSAPQSSHTYALEYDKLIARIRELEGFENFLRPKTFTQLASACATGPVVVINMHKSRCDALILCRAGDVVHVPLPDFSLVHAYNLQTWIWDFLRRTCLLSRWRGETMDEPGGEDRGGRVVAKAAPDLMRELLATLWIKVVKPVMDVVSTLMPSNGVLPHVTWCPTGPLAFLPLHAAGIYPKSVNDKTPLQTIMDIAVSSYTPTLEAPLKTRTNVAAAKDYPRVLIISQPNTPGYSPISGTTKEAGVIASLLDSSMSRTLDDAEGTIDAVLQGMTTHNWVHLACHGIQDREDPVNSAFALYDGRLTLEMLMSKHLPNADLAVLSACQTATGDENLPEEAVHLAAGMLNVGYKSVIGTMWSISDSSAPLVMKTFYEVMVAQVKAGGDLEPVYALHEATKVLREKYGVLDFVRWLPFVHYGL